MDEKIEDIIYDIDKEITMAWEDKRNHAYIKGLKKAKKIAEKYLDKQE